MINNQEITAGAVDGSYLQFGSSSGPIVSWQGLNDLSARPAASGERAAPIVLNTLGDLTNRENRFAYSRFANDFWSMQIIPPIRAAWVRTAYPTT